MWYKLEGGVKIRYLTVCGKDKNKFICPRSWRLKPTYLGWWGVHTVVSGELLLEEGLKEEEGDVDREKRGRELEGEREEGN